MNMFAMWSTIMRSNGRASEYSTAYAMCLLLMQLRSMINLKAYLVTSNLKERSRHSLGIAMKCPISCRHSTKSPSKGSRTNSNSTLGGVVRSNSVHREYIRMSHLEYTRIISTSIVFYYREKQSKTLYPQCFSLLRDSTRFSNPRRFQELYLQ